MVDKKLIDKQIFEHAEKVETRICYKLLKNIIKTIHEEIKNHVKLYGMMLYFLSQN